jgi:hypothetical protein
VARSCADGSEPWSSINNGYFCDQLCKYLILSKIWLFCSIKRIFSSDLAVGHTESFGTAACFTSCSGWVRLNCLVLRFVVAVDKTESFGTAACFTSCSSWVRLGPTELRPVVAAIGGG